jgi:hypothetical protein
MPDRPIRVLHVPAVVGGHAIGLARAERELGLDSRVVAFDLPPFGYVADEVLFADVSPLRREFRRWSFFRRALREADVIHFNFGSTILPRYWPSVHRGTRAVYGLYARLVEGRDLRALRRAGKGIVVTFQGDDARQESGLKLRVPEVHGRWISDYYDLRDDARKRVAIARFDRHAHALFALNPDLLDVLPARAEFLPYASVDPHRVEVPSSSRSDPPLVVHMPTDRRVKGTEHIVRATASVGAQLRLVENASHAEALRAIEAADVVVDQLLTGWYGGVAVEALARARPVIAHLHEPDLARLPEAMRAELPVIDATPETLEDVLRATLSADRGELGQRGRAYAERWHDPLQIAERTRAAYERSVAITTTST